MIYKQTHSHTQTPPTLSETGVYILCTYCNMFSAEK